MENCWKEFFYSMRMEMGWSEILIIVYLKVLMLSISGSQASESSRQSVSVTGLVSEILLQNSEIVIQVVTSSPDSILQ